MHYKNWFDDNPNRINDYINYFRGIIAPYLSNVKLCPALDVGCGMGFGMNALMSMGYDDVDGVDIDSQQVNACVKRGLKAYLVDDVIKYLEKKSEHYGVVLMLDVLEHIPPENQIDTMKAVYNSLAPMGRVILTVPNASSIMATRHRYIDYTHYCSFTEHSLSFVLKSAGFENVIMANRKPIKHISLKLWKAENRRNIRKWIIRWLWRQVLAEYYGHCEAIDRISLELNIEALAIKEISKS
ncbi:MAG: class I SAM-dependent methyltransferase [Candidatus Omnitrophica bacterium]|nr:class I SAM-dependent methyltransferase [Candidatus Omnitrophota bacterium]MDD5670470.1 class I SAM-dependent methyltransferase [Candidatus Omnitrophota bacterium]